jgi:hypothetical protein
MNKELRLRNSRAERSHPQVTSIIRAIAAIRFDFYRCCSEAVLKIIRVGSKQLHFICILQILQPNLKNFSILIFHF